MSAERAMRLARTLAVAGIICLGSDHDFIFNGLDLLTMILCGASVALLAYAKGW